MAPINHSKLPIAADFAVLENRVALALARREQLIKSWTEASSRLGPPLKSQADLEAEDADLFRVEPPRLGLGAPIPEGYQKSHVARDKALYQSIVGKKTGLQASKQRDAQEKAGSAKRRLNEESSDEDEGRSTLGKTKKSKIARHPSGPIKPSNKQPMVVVEQEKNLNPRPESTATSRQVSQHTVKQQTKQETKVDNRFQELSSHSQKKPPVIKKPLVDYASDDWEENETSSTSSKKASFKQLSAPSSSRKMPSESESSISTSHVLSTGVLGNKYNISKDRPLSKSLFKTGSKTSSNGSKHSSTTSTSSDSEVSDMRAVIITQLTSDVVAKVDLPTPSESNLLPTESPKKQRRRDQKARRREKRRLEKDTTGMDSANPVASLGGLLGRKLKDRLLDANGNGKGR